MLSYAQGHVISAIAFNKAHGTPSSTKVILIGTTKVLQQCQG